MPEVKYLTKRLLLEVAKEGDRIGFNRQIEPSILPVVTDQWMPITGVMPHDFIGGEPAEPHRRCLVNFRVKGNAKTHFVFIDMTEQRYDSLPIAKVGGSANARGTKPRIAKGKR